MLDYCLHQKRENKRKGMKLEEISINKSNLVDLGISTNKNIIVPEYINDKKWNILWHIIGIDDNAFEEDKTLESIVLPSSIKTIGAKAFCDCKNLKTINIPKKLERIGEAAFERCLSLKK